MWITLFLALLTICPILNRQNSAPTGKTSDRWRPGRTWQQIIASLAFETKADLSQIEYFDEHDQARLFNILDAFMSRELRVEEISSVYLEFFQHPEDWVEPQEN